MATLRDRADNGRECADLSEALQILHLSGWISMCLPTETERERVSLFEASHNKTIAACDSLWSPLCLNNGRTIS